MKRVVLLACLIAMVAGAQAAKQYRDFTDSQGRTIRGRVVSYDAARKSVRFERDNRKTATVPITIFSEADQAYILEWDAAKGFMSESLFKISCDKKRVNQRKEKIFDDIRNESGDVNRELMKEVFFESIAFNAQLQNMNASPLQNIRMEYIIYYEQSDESWEKPVAVQKYFKDEIVIPTLAARKRTEVASKPVEVFKDSIAQKDWISGRTRTGGKGEVHGFRARLFMKMPSGKEVRREVVFPEKLSDMEYPWKR